MVEPAASIVASKVRRPPARRDGVERNRLLTHLADGFDRGASVALLCAPAGSGKTTLLTAYLDRFASHRVAWLNVDGYDNEPARFWAHLITGLAASSDDREPVPLAMARTGDWAGIVEAISASLERSGEQWVVLDDYHEITSSVIHEHVDLLLRWLPPAVRVAISSRLDPPFPIINRLRLDGRLVELRADDLAFDVEEGGRLLATASSQNVSPEVSSWLVGRTEGWAAGLHLAALSIKRTGDPAAVIDRFEGDDRLVADYLRAEFLSELDPATRRFLLHTSVLDELTGELCDEVADTTGSAARLRDLERGNLLLIPLDDRGRRYRNHHLITQWLRSELTLTEPDVVPELHRRAAQWYLTAGTAEPAHRHAAASGDAELVVDVVERFWHDLLMSGRNVTVRNWFEELGPTIETSASLCIGRAKLARNTGEPAETAAAWLQRAEKLIDPADTRTVVLLHTNLVVHERMVGDLGAAERHGRAALAAVTDPALVPEVRSLLGATLAQLGSFIEAVDHLQGAIDTMQPGTDHLTALFARAHIALPLYESGQRQRSREAALGALVWAEDADYATSPILGSSRTVLGLLCLDEGLLDEANAHLERALVDTTRSRAVTSRVHALLGLARHASVTSHAVQAKELLAEAKRLTNTMPDPGRLADLVEVASHQYLNRKPSTTSDGATLLVEDLTERELAVLRLLPSDLALRDIGSELFVSHNTVKGHVKAIYRKLAVHNRDEAVARSRELNLL
ncbi:MAG: LuxR C-terminal-related transcriptional regulator [Acidimicrobiales bacterium]